MQVWFCINVKICLFTVKPLLVSVVNFLATCLINDLLNVAHLCFHEEHYCLCDNDEAEVAETYENLLKR